MNIIMNMGGSLEEERRHQHVIEDKRKINKDEALLIVKQMPLVEKGKCEDGSSDTMGSAET